MRKGKLIKDIRQFAAISLVTMGFFGMLFSEIVTTNADNTFTVEQYSSTEYQSDNIETESIQGEPVSEEESETVESGVGNPVEEETAVKGIGEVATEKNQEKKNKDKKDKEEKTTAKEKKKKETTTAASENNDGSEVVTQKKQENVTTTANKKNKKKKKNNDTDEEETKSGIVGGIYNSVTKGLSYDGLLIKLLFVVIAILLVIVLVKLKKKYDEYRYYHGSEEANGVLTALSKLSKKDIYEEEQQTRPSLLDDEPLFFDGNDRHSSFLADDSVKSSDNSYVPENIQNTGNSFLADEATAASAVAASTVGTSAVTEEDNTSAGAFEQCRDTSENYDNIKNQDSLEYKNDSENTDEAENKNDSEYQKDNEYNDNTAALNDEEPNPEDVIKVDENSLGYLVGDKAKEVFSAAGIKESSTGYDWLAEPEPKKEEEHQELYLVEVDEDEGYEEYGRNESFIVDDTKSHIESFLSEFRKTGDNYSDNEYDGMSQVNKKKLNKKKKKYKK